MVRALVAVALLLSLIAFAQTMTLQSKDPPGNRAYNAIVTQLTNDKINLSFQVEQQKDQITALQQELEKLKANKPLSTPIPPEFKATFTARNPALKLPPLLWRANP